ncbi:hypothetical protein [[Mycobacterium] wendilense]|uniref:Uncharacterized protein n=1 Tax=[Mycobacterium] wendilense TaxID=3064284 RepID=A0ABN9NY81_9MYCO|nr:hypothetical protein [Mycolicibacterium sp. MU0050]CAJ1579812.1 hypothetical protein MU0050_000700 [Mycolicibacterium sp. MU0050]
MTVPVTLLNPAIAGRTVVGLDLSLTGAGIASLDLVTGDLDTAVHRSPAPKVDTLGAHVSRHRALVDGIVQQAIACDPALVVVEGLRFSVSAQDSSLSRRGFLWWAVVEGLVHAGAPVLEVTPSQIKMLATGNGGASKDMMVAEYALAWPDATRDKNTQDRADAAFAAALGAAYLRSPLLPFKVTGKRRQALAKLAAPSTPPRICPRGAVA